MDLAKNVFSCTLYLKVLLKHVDSQLVYEGRNEVYRDYCEHAFTNNVCAYGPKCDLRFWWRGRFPFCNR
jgi:hypothetical protein